LKYAAILSIAVTLILSSVSAKAQDDDLLLASANPSSPASPVVSETNEIDPVLDQPKFEFPLIDIHQKVYFPDYWTELANRPSVYTKIEFEGLHKVLYKQLTRHATKFYEDQLRDLWDNSSLHPIELDARIRQYELESSDFGDRFWERRRYWWDNLPAEQGGARVEEYKIGTQFELARVGPLSVMNTGKVSWAGWGLSIDREPDDQIIDKDIVHNDIRYDKARSRTISRIDTADYALGIRPPKGNLYNGEFFSVSGSVNVNIKLDDIKDNGSSIRGELQLMSHATRKKIPWLSVTLLTRCKPLREQYSVQLVFSILTF